MITFRLAIREISYGSVTMGSLADRLPLSPSSRRLVSCLECFAAGCRGGRQPKAGPGPATESGARGTAGKQVDGGPNGRPFAPRAQSDEREVCGLPRLS